MSATRLPPGPHLDLLHDALDVEARAQVALLAGDLDGARADFATAARTYRASYECAPPASYGRLVGMLKAAVLAGDATDAAAYARGPLGDAEPTPTVGYGRAIVALIEGDVEAARRGAEQMRGGDDRFGRAADAIAAIADRDEQAFARASGAIVADFEGRDEHLTGVAIADTAVMLARLATGYGLVAGSVSGVMPPV